MSNFWWLQPGWTETLCAACGAKIWPEGDPDHGLCYPCWQAQWEAQHRSEEAAPDKEG
jgi:hypothetical protein